MSRRVREWKGGVRLAIIIGAMNAMQSKSTIVLDVPLRGARDYVHSSDLFAVLDGLAKIHLSPDAHLQSLVLRRMAFHQVIAHFAPHADAFGTFSLCLGQDVTEGWLVEGRDAIARRVAFDETPIERAAVSRTGRVLLPAPVAGYTSFEQMIVLFKILCAQLRRGHWLLTQMNLIAPFKDHLPRELATVQTVLGQLMKAELRQGRGSIGQAQMVLANAAGGFS